MFQIPISWSRAANSAGAGLRFAWIFDSRATAVGCITAWISSKCHGLNSWVSTPTSGESARGSSGRMPCEYPQRCHTRQGRRFLYGICRSQKNPDPQGQSYNRQYLSGETQLFCRDFVRVPDIVALQLAPRLRPRLSFPPVGFPHSTDAPGFRSPLSGTPIAAPHFTENAHAFPVLASGPLGAYCQPVLSPGTCACRGPVRCCPAPQRVRSCIRFVFALARSSVVCRNAAARASG